MKLLEKGRGELPPWMDEMFRDGAERHLWTPEVLRRVGGAVRCAKPPLIDVEQAQGDFGAWGPLLPLLHFHLAWPHVDMGLARWAQAGFADLDDPTLRVVRELWGPGLRAFVYWYVFVSQYSDSPGLATEQLRDTLGGERSDHQSQAFHLGGAIGGSDWQHLGAHFGSPYGHLAFPFDAPSTRSEDWREVHEHGPGHRELVVPTYAGWYRTLTQYGDRLPALPDGRSWRLDVTIAPIGYIGQFRRSRVSGRWFAGRHKAHQLGV